jgi:predicted metal-dependent phosphoesterase TrpH
MILKTNLHFHTSEDPLDLFIKYDIYKGIREAKRRGFKVLASTCHDKFIYKKEYGQYAKEQGILLIPGVEIEIKRAHVIILNADKEAEKIRTFAALKRYKEKNKKAFVIAPHPYFGMFSLNGKLNRNIKLFDAIEGNWFFMLGFNRNKKAKEIAEKYKKPYIASSDTHNIRNINKSYTLIDSPQLSIDSVLESIRSGRYKNVMTRLNIFSVVGYLCWYNFSQLKVLVNGIIGNKGRINIRIPFLDRNNFAIKRGALLFVLFVGLAFYLIVN